MKLCHSVSNLTERQSKCRARLFTCKCGKKWSYTQAAGYYQQGAKRKHDPKVMIATKRVTASELAAIRAGKAELVVRWITASP